MSDSESSQDDFFLSSDECDLLRKYFSNCGVILHECQLLEENLRHFLELLYKLGLVDFNSYDEDELFNKRRRQPLLSTLKKALEAYKFYYPESLTVIDRAITRRNRFVHTTVKDGSEAVLSPAERENVFQQLDASYVEIKAAGDTVFQNMLLVLESAGLSRTDYWVKVRERVERLRNGTTKSR